MSREISGLPFGSTLARIRQLAEAHVDPIAAHEQAEADRSREQVDRRTARLRAAGLLDPEAVAAVVALDACGRCPRVDGHPGSEAASSAVESWLADDQLRTLALLGPTGRGKSFAAAWVLAEQAGAWLPATECRVAGWDDLRPKAVGARLLVLDDLGREGSEWAARELADVLELRHNRGLRTLVTSNLTAERIADRYGERVASRWGDDRFTRIVPVLGPDLRARPRFEVSRDR